MISHASANRVAIRASDAERERMVRKLEREFAAGRLSMPEFEQRIVAAQEALTREQLRALTLDLPSDPVRRETVAAPEQCLLCFLLCMFRPARHEGSRPMAHRKDAW